MGSIRACAVALTVFGYGLLEGFGFCRGKVGFESGLSRFFRWPFNMSVGLQKGCSRVLY